MTNNVGIVDWFVNLFALCVAIIVGTIVIMIMTIAVFIMWILRIVYILFEVLFNARK